MEISLNNYEKILLEVQKIITETQKEINEKVNYEKVEMSWKIGQIIYKHLLQNDRADYGSNFFTQLSKDTKLSVSSLYQMQNFYKSYPTLPSPENNLSWNQYRAISSVKNKRSRDNLEKLAIESDTGFKTLKQKISKLKNRKKSDADLEKEVNLKFNRGRLFTYKITSLEEENKIFVDCGFNIFHEINSEIKDEGAIVSSIKTEEEFTLQKLEISKNQLHTYKAKLDRVVDGDTITVIFDLGFNIRHKEIIRLAQINAPELKTFAGQESKRKLEEILKNVEFLVIKTNKTDIYGRYIGDVFFSQTGEKDAQKIADEGIYLNQMILDFGLAEAY